MLDMKAMLFRRSIDAITNRLQRAPDCGDNVSGRDCSSEVLLPLNYKVKSHADGNYVERTRTIALFIYVCVIKWIISHNIILNGLERRSYSKSIKCRYNFPSTTCYWALFCRRNIRLQNRKVYIYLGDTHKKYPYQLGLRIAFDSQTSELLLLLLEVPIECDHLKCMHMDHMKEVEARELCGEILV